MAKFKIGDRVRLKSNLEGNHYLRHRGIMRIVNVNPLIYKIQTSQSGIYFHEDDFDLVESSLYKIGDIVHLLHMGGDRKYVVQDIDFCGKDFDPSLPDCRLKLADLKSGESRGWWTIDRVAPCVSSPVKISELPTEGMTLEQVLNRWQHLYDNNLLIE